MQRGYTLRSSIDIVVGRNVEERRERVPTARGEAVDAVRWLIFGNGNQFAYLRRQFGKEARGVEDGVDPVSIASDIRANEEEAVPGAGDRDIEKPAFFLLVIHSK